MNTRFRNSILALTATVLVSAVTYGQYPGGTGTTGATDGSGRGTGSAGVQTGGGPDTSSSLKANQVNIFAPQQGVSTTTATSVSTSAQNARNDSQKPRKKSRKTTKRSRPSGTTAPTATISPH